MWQAALMPALDKLGTEDEAKQARGLVARMLTKHPMQRPVVDVVLQEAILKLYPEHELDLIATVGPPSQPPSPTRSRAVSPPRMIKRPLSLGPSEESSQGQSVSPTSERGEEGTCGEGGGGLSGDENGRDWGENRVREKAPVTPRGSSGAPPAACECRCAVM